MKERRSVAVFVFRATEPRFLLLHRIPERGAFWQPVTGRVEEEDVAAKASPAHPAALAGLMACAAREVWEETGIRDILSIIDLELESRFQGYDDTVYLERAFAAEVPPEARVARSHEHDDERWVTAEEAARLLRWDENREALRRLLTILEGRATTA